MVLSGLLVAPLLGVLVLGASGAATASSDAGVAAAGALARLFERTCLRHADDRRALAGELAASRYRPVPNGALARPGQAYAVDGEPGHLMVLAFDDGWCGNGGTGIDPHALTIGLARLALADHAGMRLMGTDESGREQRYLLTRPAPAAPIALLVLLQPADAASRGGALQQATLFTAAMPPPGGPR